MPDTWELASVLGRFLLYLGVLGSTGLVLARTVFHRETGAIHVSIARQSAAFVVLALLASGIDFALKGAAMTGEASGMADFEMLGLLWQTPAGTALALRITGLALILLGLWIPVIGLPITVGGGVLTLWSFSQAGHIPEAEPFWLEFLLLLHLAGIAFWIGTLSPLRRIAGDCENLSQAAGLELPGNSKLVMLALPNPAASLAVLDQLTAAAFRGRVAATARYHDEVEPLEQAGASTVFNLYAEAGSGFAAHVAEQSPPSSTPCTSGSGS